MTGVTVETVRLQNVPDAYEAVGTVRSATTSVLGAEIAGTVREIRVKPGDRVKRGQVLALLDDRSQRAQLAAAQASVEEAQFGLAETEQALEAAAAERKLAEVTYKRYQELLAKNSVTRQEFDGAEARYKSALANEAAIGARKKAVEARGQEARSQHESAQTLFSYASIVSPIDGVVTSKPVDAGTLVMPGTPLLTVEDTAHFRLEATVPQELLFKIRLGQRATVWTERGQFDGEVIEDRARRRPRQPNVCGEGRVAGGLCVPVRRVRESELRYRRSQSANHSSLRSRGARATARCLRRGPARHCGVPFDYNRQAFRRAN